MNSVLRWLAGPTSRLAERAAVDLVREAVVADGEGGPLLAIDLDDLTAQMIAVLQRDLIGENCGRESQKYDEENEAALAQHVHASGFQRSGTAQMQLRARRITSRDRIGRDQDKERRQNCSRIKERLLASASFNQALVSFESVVLF